MIRALSKRELNNFLKQHSLWTINKKGTELTRTIKHRKYIDGLVAIARISVYAELLQHHPDITFTYDTIKIKLSTHALKALTKLDTDLAARIDTLFPVDDIM